MAVGIKEIAIKTGYSEATVSLALNGNEAVNKNTKKIICETAEELGYIPNSAARNLARKKSGCLGLVIPDIENVFYASLVKYINEAVKKRGYNLLIAVSDNNADEEAAIIENMIENRAEGVIIVPMSVPNAFPEYIKSLEKYSVPFVFCSDYYEGFEKNTPVIMSDSESGMYELVKNIIDMGYRNLVYLTAKEGVPSLDQRKRGFDNAASECGVNTKIFRLPKIDYKSACEAARKILKEDPEIDAFVCVNDMIAVGVVNTLSAMGISVPEEKGVAGFDNVVFSQIAYPRIATSEQDIESIAQKSVDCLLDIKNCYKKILIPTKITLRDSLKKLI